MNIVRTAAMLALGLLGFEEAAFLPYAQSLDLQVDPTTLNRKLLLGYQVRGEVGISANMPDSPGREVSRNQQ